MGIITAMLSDDTCDKLAAVVPIKLFKRIVADD